MELGAQPERVPVLPSATAGRLSVDGVWAFTAVAMAVLLGFFGRLSATDLTYHLRAGETILSSHHLPGVDAYTFTAAGRPWLDQQWGAQVLMTLVYRVGGFAALAVFRGVIVGASFWLLWLACRARGATPRTSSILTVAGLAVGFLNTGMRPQTLAFPLFGASLLILARRRAHPGALWALPVIAAIWANMHGSFLVLPVVLVIAAAEDLRDHARTQRLMVVTGSLAILATLLNPFGIGAWRYAIGITTNERILQQIIEWQPTSVRTVAGALFFVSALAIAAYLARRGERSPRRILIWLGAFFLLALPALRGVVWWSFAFPFALAALPEARVDAKDDRRGSPAMNRILVGALVAACAISLPWWRARTDPSTGASSLLASAPQGLVDATEQRLSPGGRALVAQPFASWFEFAAPEIPVFVDSRIELYPDQVWADYLDVMNGRQGWQAILDRWGVDALVLEADDTEDDTELISRVANDPAWRLAYRDAEGLLFVRS